MALDTKLKNYFKENGIQKKWFAEQLGMKAQQFSQVVCGFAPLPAKYWKKIIKMTDGAITLGDILSQRLSELENIEIKAGKSCEKCEVSLKDFNVNT